VIYCSDRAMANGFSYAASHEWANLGQGAPEVGEIPNAPPRIDSIPVPVDSNEYAPTTGVKGPSFSRNNYTLLLFPPQSFARPWPTCTTTLTVRERLVNTHTRTSASCPVGARVFRVSLPSSVTSTRYDKP
jgi:hypothetical protein